MNNLIDTIFGDAYISLTCEGGECLHYSQVPGYVVCHTFSSAGGKANPIKRPPKPDNTMYVVMSSAGASLIVALCFGGMQSSHSCDGLLMVFSALVCWSKWEGRGFCTDPPSGERSGQADVRSCPCFSLLLRHILHTREPSHPG